MLSTVTASPPSEHEPADAGEGAGSASGAPAAARGLPPMCPFLAGTNGSWRSVEPAKSHVCAAVDPPAVLAIGKQRQLCLGAGHVDCATFRAARALIHTPARGSLDADLWPSSSSRVTTLDPVRVGLAGGLTTPQARAGGQALLVGLIVIVFAVLVVARSTPAGSSAPSGGSPVPTAAAGAGASARPSGPPTAAPSLPAAAPSGSAAPSVTGSSAPSLPVGRTYKVKRGDTLSSIALEFGVTLKALRKANDLTKDAVIRPGQVLAIPSPAGTPAP